MILRGACFGAVMGSLALFPFIKGAAQSNIDPLSSLGKFGYLENAGWLNLEGDGDNGVVVTPDYLSGFAWSPSVGWINFGDGSPDNGTAYSNASGSDFGVNNDGSGNLSGFAWGENIGWIAFDTSSVGGSLVTIDAASGRFRGYAWSEGIGWLSFETVPMSFVATVPTAAVPVELDSFVVD